MQCFKGIAIGVLTGIVAVGGFVGSVSHPAVGGSDWAGALKSLPTLEALPSGQYVYRADALPEQASRSLLVHKVGQTVIGVDRQRGAARFCFRGFAAGNRIVNATRIFPPYQPDSRWDYQSGDWLDVSRYPEVDQALTDAETADLLTCLQVFGR